MVLGVCLFTLPSKNDTANAADNTTTSLTENTAIQWKTVELNGTHAQILQTIAAVAADEPYVKYVLQTNWSITSGNSSYGVYLKGWYIVFDLRGHAVTYTDNLALSPATSGVNKTRVFEITDSSAGRNGSIVSSFYLSCIRGAPITILSGGKLSGLITRDYIDNFILVAGSVENTNNGYPPFYWGEPDNLCLPKYATTDHQMYYRATSTNTNGASFAIYGSTNDYVSSAYNYEFSTITENLGPGDCILEKLINPYQPNYLLYRANPTAPYQTIATL